MAASHSEIDYTERKETKGRFEHEVCASFLQDVRFVRLRTCTDDIWKLIDRTGIKRAIKRIDKRWLRPGEIEAHTCQQDESEYCLQLLRTTEKLNIQNTSASHGRRNTIDKNHRSWFEGKWNRHIQAWKKMDHPHVCRLVESCMWTRHSFVVYTPFGSFRNLWHSRGFFALPATLVISGSRWSLDRYFESPHYVWLVTELCHGEEQHSWLGALYRFDW